MQIEEEFENTIDAIRTDSTMTKRKRSKGQTIIY